jgi:O-antigen biosynthesis protein
MDHSASEGNDDALQRKVREQKMLIERQELKIKRLEDELHQVLHSKVWRYAEVLRRVIRVPLYTLFPSLQLHILPALVRWYRNKIFLPLVRRGVLTGDYERWVKLEQKAQRKYAAVVEAQLRSLQYVPLISIVMPVYNVKPEWLRHAIVSVQQQSYAHWQLCIADDCSTDPRLKDLLTQFAKTDARIQVQFLEENRGIAGASNAALAMAEGEFVGLLDHDDTLASDALFAIVKAINAEPDLDCLYSDEDKITEKGRRYDPFFKPDWSPDTLRSYNYLCHFTVIRRALAAEVGGFRAGFDGSQDYDLFLRVTEKSSKIAHIPHILYHWRAIEGSVGKRADAKMYAYDSGKKALEEHLLRTGIEAKVESGLFLGSYHMRYKVYDRPQVAIIIPTKDKVEVLKRCIDSIRERTTYLHYRIVVVDNGSKESATHAYYASLTTQPNITVLKYDHPFNFSSINNYAVRQTDAEYLLFLNNDTEVITPGWLEEMLGYIQRPNVGAVGSALYYPNDTVQHGGIIIGIGGVAGHSHKYFPRSEYGYFGRLKTVQNLSAVTAACLMTKRTVLVEVGGFEETLSHAFNDVDLCLKIRDKGYLVVYTPFAELYHHESMSRGYENTPDKILRFQQEMEFCEDRWLAVFHRGDPYYNPHLTLEREDFSLGFSAVSRGIG